MATKSVKKPAAKKPAPKKPAPKKIASKPVAKKPVAKKPAAKKPAAAKKPSTARTVSMPSPSAGDWLVTHATKDGVQVVKAFPSMRAAKAFADGLTVGRVVISRITARGQA